MKQIYLDNAATTRVLPEIAEAMAKTMTENYGNPSSIYTLGQSAHEILDEARIKVAKLINAASPEEITFTCGGSEGDSMLQLPTPVTWSVLKFLLMFWNMRRLFFLNKLVTKVNLKRLLKKWLWVVFKSSTRKFAW